MSLRNRSSTDTYGFLLIVTLLALVYPHIWSVAPVYGAMEQNHAPIVINGNQGFTTANGVIAGNGSAANPFIIGGWNITTAGQNGFVALIGTTAHLIIRDVHASGAGNGFFFWNAANDVLENSSATYATDGVTISDSANITVANCIFDHDGYGINAVPFQSSVSSTNSWYTGNRVTNSGTGVYIVTSVNMVFANNTVSGNGTGVSITAIGSRIVENTANNNTANGGYGMLVTGTNNLVSENNVSSDQFGLVVGGSNNQVVSNTAFSDVSGIAIGEFARGSNTTISQNDVEQNTQYGIIVNNGSTGTNVTQNLVANNQWSGIFVSGTTSTTVVENTVSKSGTGITVSYSTHALIYHNNWIQNTHQAAGAGNTGSTGTFANSTYSFGSFWNSSYPAGGNYWSDYTGSDYCSGALQNNCSKPDGIGDAPYTLGLADQRITDYYPLMTPYQPGPDFSLGPGSITRSVLPGSQVTSIVSITPLRGFTGAVALTLAFPAEVKCSLDNTSIQSRGWTFLKCTANSPGNYVVIISAKDSLMVHSETITLQVTQPSKTPPASTNLPKVSLQTIFQLPINMIIQNWKQVIIGMAGVWAALILTALGFARRNQRARITTIKGSRAPMA